MTNPATELTEAQKADQRAADEAFLLRIEEYAIADIQNKALRSPKWSRDWNRTLGTLTQRRNVTKQFSVILNERRIEAARLVREHNILKAQITDTISSIIEKRSGLKFEPGHSLNEIDTLVSLEILMELRELRAQLRKIEDVIWRK